MAEERVNKIYLSGTPSEIKSNLTNIYGTYQLNQSNQPEVIIINPLPPLGGTTEKPQVTLYFLQKNAEASADYSAIDGSPSFRLMNHDENVTLEQAKALAEKIKAGFATPLMYWDKGKELTTYNDWKKGYRLQIGCPNEVEGRRIVEQILDIQGHSIDEDKLNHKVNKAPAIKYPDIPDKKVVMGESVRERRYMARGRVWFRYAFLTIPNINRVYTLLDTTGSIPNPVLPMERITANYATDTRTYTRTPGAV